jgi:hypothetical protein
MAIKRCPLCHGATKIDDPECRCGYVFGQSVDQVLTLLRERRTSARIVLALLLVVDLLAVAGVVYAILNGIIVISMLAFAGVFSFTVHAIVKLSIIRRSIRVLANRKLPEARVITSSREA